jgi:hypothetical protein
MTNGGLKQIGLVSFGIGESCGKNGNSVGMPYLPYYSDWIDAAIEKAAEPINKVDRSIVFSFGVDMRVTGEQTVQLYIPYGMRLVSFSTGVGTMLSVTFVKPVTPGSADCISISNAAENRCPLLAPVAGIYAIGLRQYTVLGLVPSNLQANFQTWSTSQYITEMKGTTVSNLKLYYATSCVPGSSYTFKTLSQTPPKYTIYQGFRASNAEVLFSGKTSTKGDLKSDQSSAIIFEIDGGTSENPFDAEFACDVPSFPTRSKDKGKVERRNYGIFSWQGNLFKDNEFIDVARKTARYVFETLTNGQEVSVGVTFSRVCADQPIISSSAVTIELWVGTGERGVNSGDIRLEMRTEIKSGEIEIGKMYTLSAIAPGFAKGRTVLYINACSPRYHLSVVGTVDSNSKSPYFPDPKFV